LTKSAVLSGRCGLSLGASDLLLPDRLDSIEGREELESVAAASPVGTGELICRGALISLRGPPLGRFSVRFLRSEMPLPRSSDMLAIVYWASSVYGVVDVAGGALRATNDMEPASSGLCRAMASLSKKVRRHLVSKPALHRIFCSLPPPPSPPPSQLAHRDNPHTMSSSIKPSTIAAISVGTLVTGFLAYAVYFDHRRRTDPDFRKQLKRESKAQARAAKAEAEAQGKEQKQAIRDAVARANEEGFPKDPEEVEAYFMQEVAQGEGMCQQGMQIPFC